MLRRRLALLMGMVMMVALVAACGGEKTPEGAQEGEASPSKEKVVLRVMTRAAGTDPKAEIYQRAYDAFEKAHPNVEIQNDAVAEEGAYNNKLRADIATGNPPNIFVYPGAASVVYWAENGVIMNLDEMLKPGQWYDGFSEGAFDKWNLGLYGVEGHYGLPIEVNPEVIYYNTALFEQAGIEKTPETMEEFYTVIDKLNEANILPLGTGAKDTWRAGHIFNNLIYKAIGVDGVVELGARTKSWDDEDVVNVFRLTKDLKDRNAFQPGFEGIDYNTEKNMFHSGMAAMSIDGAWQISEIVISDNTAAANIDFFKFPYFADKPEFKEDQIVFGSGFFLSGVAKGLEREMQIELAKYLTGQEFMQMLADEASVITPRKDVQPSEDAPELLKKMMAYAATIKKPGGDYSDYDTAPQLLDKSRDVIIGMMLGTTPEEAAGQVKEVIDQYDANK